MTIDSARFKALARKAKAESVSLTPPWDVNSNIWATECGKVLIKHYPRYNWAIRYQSKQGIVEIVNMSVVTQWKLIIRIDDLDWPRLDVVKTLAGEYLERLGLRRGTASDAELADLPTDYRGHNIIDTTAIPERNR